MGKIRVKTLGDEELEKKQKNQDKKRQETKKTVKGAHGGERIVSVGPTEEELEKIEAAKEPASNAAAAEAPKEKKSAKDRSSSGRKKEKFTKKKIRSKKYQVVAKLVDKNKQYSLSDALELLPKLKTASFDETVEMHLTTTLEGISGNITLPHGTGKQTRVAIATDELIEKLEKGLLANASPSGDGRRGKIDFDILLATPQIMPKLAKVARVLGPKGLMPNPKNGTITTNPEEALKKFAGGLINYKTENKNPIMHLTVGKLSFGNKKLQDNINAILQAVKTERIKKAVLKSTMSPGIRIQI